VNGVLRIADSWSAQWAGFQTKGCASSGPVNAQTR
jgi:hypothetical protein